MKQQIGWLLALFVLAGLGSCQKDSFPGAQINPYISIFDIRDIYRGGTDIALSMANMGGSDSIAGVVITDHKGGNIPDDLLMLQDHRRLSKLRGIAISVPQAADYTTGDSIVVNVNGRLLTRKDGLLKITGVTSADIRKVSSGNAIATNRVTTASILANPDNYESTLVDIVKGGPNPLPKTEELLSGDHVINDGFGNIHLITDNSANFADSTVPVLANYRSIVMNALDANNQSVPYLKLCTAGNITVLSSEVNLVPIVITGFMNDPSGTDSSYEYIQLMATRDIDFSETPYSVVTTNNAGASTPTGYPTKGWATGGLRTYKLNLTSGKATKGSYFYVGGTAKLINGPAVPSKNLPASTSIASANWITAYPYVTQGGQGFGAVTQNLLANSGNAFGIAVFKDTTVTVDSEPLDVIFVGSGGSIFTAGPPALGYKITNTDFYDKVDPISLQSQPFYRSGSNTLFFAYTTADLGYFNLLGGVYNISLGRWTKARVDVPTLLTKSSTIAEIENDNSTKIEE